MPAPHNGDSIRSPRTRARTAGIRSALLVTLVAAGVAACVSAGSEPDPRPSRVPSSASRVADGPGGGRLVPGAVRPAGKNGLSPSPSASGSSPSPGASRSASPSPHAKDKPADRALPPAGAGVTVPQPTAEATPTQQAPPPTTPAAEPTTAPTPDPPSQSDSPAPPESPAAG
ncbi:hypothetical protein ACFO3J_31660 [Streptomyces polygonati]|uniref:Uncharacterized protein n=1 Tax=Streptomyces polygonati TaxID=1617087 RepID=A0ABV8HY78_9ACTN